MLGRRILLLIPHPDDEVVGCAAVIGRARAAGARVFGVYLTTGVPPEENAWFWARRRHPARAARRRTEAEAAARLLGIEPVAWQDVPSRRLKDNLSATAAQLDRAVSESGADMIWAPAWEGGHQDHDTANFLASRLTERLPVWEYSEYNFAGGRVRSQRFPETNGTETVIRLSGEEIAMKRQALALYRSERMNLSHVRTVRECLRPLVAYDYGQAPHPGRLFWQRFQWAPQTPYVDDCRPETVRAALAAFASETLPDAAA